MDRESLVAQVTREVLRVLAEREQLPDLTSREYKQSIRLSHSQSEEALDMIRRNTPARVGIGRAGARLNTRTMLALRADHANARDAVLRNVDEDMIKEMGLFTVKTKCCDIRQHLTRPDLGRQFDEAALEKIREHCQMNPDVQIYISDGLSSSAVDANVKDMLPVMLEELRSRGISTGAPFFVKFGRVPAMDAISETLGAKVTCVLIGERPGLAAADSLSAYIAYEARVGMPEARRTVISNIHKGGIPSMEAGAYIAEVIETMLREKRSGVDLKL